MSEKVKFKEFIKNKDKKNNEPWLLTYSDLMSLLFAFFVLLIGVSKFDKSKYEQIRHAVSKIKVTEEKNIKEYIKHIQKEKELTKKIRKILENTKYGSQLQVIDNIEGTKIILPDKVMFKTGKADLNKEALNVLAKISEAIKKIIKEKNVYIKISGHTDEVPIHNSRYKSNWDLSAARAAAVADYFREIGIPDSKMVIEGFADTKPLEKIETNDTKEEVLRKRAKNRRVELQIFYSIEKNKLKGKDKK